MKMKIKGGPVAGMRVALTSSDYIVKAIGIVDTEGVVDFHPDVVPEEGDHIVRLPIRLGVEKVVDNSLRSVGS